MQQYNIKTWNVFSFWRSGNLPHRPGTAPGATRRHLLYCSKLVYRIDIWRCALCVCYYWYCNSVVGACPCNHNTPQRWENHNRPPLSNNNTTCSTVSSTGSQQHNQCYFATRPPLVSSPVRQPESEREDRPCRRRTIWRLKFTMMMVFGKKILALTFGAGALLGQASACSCFFRELCEKIEFADVVVRAEALSRWGNPAILAWP